MPCPALVRMSMVAGWGDDCGDDHGGNPHWGANRTAEERSQSRFGVLRVLVAEDDEGLGEVLARGLREQGYVVDLVPDGETAAAYLRFYSYEVAVLDWSMPRLSGLDLVRRLRALQRRPPVGQIPRIKIGEVEFDPAAWEALVSGCRPSLTATELGILEILMRRSPGVADRRSIAQHVWDYEADAFGSNTIDVHLARLRSKLAGAGARIETVRGVGYRIVAS